MPDASFCPRNGIDYAGTIGRGGGEPFRFTAAVIAAHPDDEVIGMGSRFHRFAALTFVHITDGAPADMRDARKAGFAGREEYARARAAEWAAALDASGVRRSDHFDAGCIDQTASLQMPELIRFLADLVADTGVEVVLTHPYEGGHPDHDATALAVHAALAVARRRTASPPSLIEFTSYHMHDGHMRTSEFIPYPDCPPSVSRLSDEERGRKKTMVACFVSQRDMLKNFSFEIESFRRAPRYDFTRPPHGGTLYYEQYDWGMDGARWIGRAAEALRGFSLEGPL